MEIIILFCLHECIALLSALACICAGASDVLIEVEWPFAETILNEE